MTTSVVPLMTGTRGSSYNAFEAVRRLLPHKFSHSQHPKGEVSMLAKISAAFGVAAALTLGVAALPAGATPTTTPATSAGAPASPGVTPDTTDGSCIAYYICYYYEANYEGSDEGVEGDVPDLTNPEVYFQGSGAGQGDPVGNDAGSGFNGDTRCDAELWYSADYSGDELILQRYMTTGYDSDNLGGLANNDRSQESCGEYG
ncbi:MAG: peptidase inhibitor family I36 protein [Candidatus Dormiibacterota bacterium]